LCALRPAIESKKDIASGAGKGTLLFISALDSQVRVLFALVGRGSIQTIIQRIAAGSQQINLDEKGLRFRAPCRTSESVLVDLGAPLLLHGKSFALIDSRRWRCAVHGLLFGNCERANGPDGTKI